MARVGAVVLGVGLVVLWIVGMSHSATPWLTWMVGLAGLVSFVVATLVPSEPGRAAAGGPGVIGFALVGFWIVGLAARSTEWLTWWAFGFGCLYIVVAIASASALPRLQHRSH